MNNWILTSLGEKLDIFSFRLSYTMTAHYTAARVLFWTATESNFKKSAHKKDDVIEKVKFRKKFQKSNDILILQNQDPDLTCVNGFVSATVEMRGSAVKGWAVGLAASSLLFLLFFGEEK